MSRAALLLVGLLLSAGPAAAAPRCDAGKTLYHRGGVRVFDVHHPEHDPGFKPTFYHQVYACAGAARWLVTESSPYNFWRMYGLRRIGFRIGFVTHDVGWDNGFSSEVGWTDVQTHRTRIGLINAGENGEPGDPYVPFDRVSYAIAGDGAMAVLGGKPKAEQQVALLEPRGRHAFRPATILMDVERGSFVHGSLRVSHSEVSWAQTDGSRITYPRG